MMSPYIPVGMEQKLFRALNAFVEPAVRRGIGSPTLLPGALVVLESTGFKSGTRRRTPLVSLRVGRYRIVSTVRGERSFWVKNLLQQSDVSYFLGGERRRARAIVLVDGEETTLDESCPRFLRALVALLATRARNGTAIVVLVPADLEQKGSHSDCPYPR